MLRARRDQQEWAARTCCSTNRPMFCVTKCQVAAVEAAVLTSLIGASFRQVQAPKARKELIDEERERQGDRHTLTLTSGTDWRGGSKQYMWYCKSHPSHWEEPERTSSWLVRPTGEPTPAIKDTIAAPAGIIQSAQDDNNTRTSKILSSSPGRLQISQESTSSTTG